MSYLVFARKYRPQTFEQVMGQDHVTRTLSNAIALGRVPHAVLFTGPRGTGKTTVARILAKAMNCRHGPTASPCNQCRSCTEITAGNAADVFEIDGASNNSVDQIRELRDNLKYMPVHSPYKIYIIDEVHMLSLAAFNALLKTLEEPPAHVMFVFATTEPQKIPITILSRCQRHDLRRIDLSAIIGHMRMICEQEQVIVDEPSLSLIAQESGGSLRDALSLLDHVLACAEGPVTVDSVGQLLGVVERQHLFELSLALLNRDIGTVLKIIDKVWRNGLEIKRFYADVVFHVRCLTMVKLGATAEGLIDLPDDDIRLMRNQVETVPVSVLVQLLDLLFQAETSIKLSSQPKSALEIMILKYFQIPTALPIEVLIDHLDQLHSNSEKSQCTGSKGAAPLVEPILAMPPKVTLQTDPIIESDKTASEPILPPRNEMEAVPVDPQSTWEKVIQQASIQKPALAALLKKCTLKSIDGGQVVIGVSSNDFVLNSVQKQLRWIEEVSSEIIGKAAKVVVEADMEELAAKEEQKKKMGLMRQKAISHPIVLEALEVFSGKVIDVKINQ